MGDTAEQRSAKRPSATLAAHDQRGLHSFCDGHDRVCDAVLGLLRQWDEVVAVFLAETRTLVGGCFGGCGFLLIYLGFVGDPCYERSGGGQLKVDGLPHGEDVAVRGPNDEVSGSLEGTPRAG